MKNPLSQVEAHLQRLVEGSLARLFPDEEMINRLARHLLDAMQKNLHQNPIERHLEAPNLYTIFLPLSQAGETTTNRQLVVALAQNLEEASLGSEIFFTHPPKVNIAADASLRTGQVRVIAQFGVDHIDETRSFLPVSSKEEQAPPFGAFLICNHNELIPLDSSVLTIGRQWDADLIIDDPRVSRLHAQIRLVEARFMVFDLGSTGGTFVNGQRIQQRTLFRGDVISLAGVDLIFGQDEVEEDETRPMKKPGPSNELFT